MPPRPRAAATATLIVGLLLTFVALPADTPSEIAHGAAIGAGLSLVGSIAIDVSRRWGALLRADLVCLVALYYLTFAEFLVPQVELDVLARDKGAIVDSVGLVLLGMATIAIGRHFGVRHTRFRVLDIRWLPPKSIVLLFWGAVAFGYFHMLYAVGFNPEALVSAFLGPRFAVPWGRPQFGDVAALFYELGATIYLVPPLAGLILGRRDSYSMLVTMSVLGALLFTLFYGFTTGTRNIIGSFLITFVVAYFYAGGRFRAGVVFLAALFMVASTIFGLQFRDVGLSNYLRDEAPERSANPAFYVDYNLHTISELVSVMPDVFPYVGWQAPLWLLVRIVPRAIWPGKPTGEAISPQAYLTVSEGTTVSATFVGEAYMWLGALGVLIAGLLIGYLASWWTSKTFSLRSDFGILLYGSGFFAVVITMRSVYMLPVAALPIVALFVLGYFAGSRDRRAPAL